MCNRYDRNELFFGKEGQEQLRKLKIAIVGIGGIGTHVVQQLAHLGVGYMYLIDAEELDVTNLNRYVGSRYDDPIPGSRKVDLAERLVKAIDPSTRIEKIFDSLVSLRGFDAVKGADYVFGCLDREGPRFILNELSLAYDRPYFDLASDIVTEPSLLYGGRVCFVSEANGCLLCLGIIDLTEAYNDLGGPSIRAERNTLYGIDRGSLGGGGPSVVSINGLVASLALTEFIALATGLREPHVLLNYHGHLGKVTVSLKDRRKDCHYCSEVRGRGEAAEVERYIVSGVGQWLR